MMTYKEYEVAAMRTMNPGRTQRERLELCALGMVGEVGEVVERFKKQLYHGKEEDDAKLVAELGDVLWYIACGRAVWTEFAGREEFIAPWMFGHEDIHWSLRGIAEPNIVALRLASAVARAADAMAVTREYMVVGHLLSVAFLAWKRLVFELDMRPRDVAERNIEKLRARWPEQFIEGAAQAAGDGGR